MPTQPATTRGKRMVNSEVETRRMKKEMRYSMRKEGRKKVFAAHVRCFAVVQYVKSTVLYLPQKVVRLYC